MQLPFLVQADKRRIVRRIYWRLMPWQRQHRFTVLGWQVWL